MTNKYQRYFSLIAAAVFIFGTLILGMMDENYNAIAQTVSEIGKLGSALEIPYRIMMFFVAGASLMFCRALYIFVKTNHMARLPVFLIAFFALMDFGFAIFPSPHKYHNVFGLLHLIGYMAPLFVAMNWRNKLSQYHVIGVSWLAFAAICVFMFLNLSPMFLRELYPLEYYGVMQRALLYTYYAWLGFLGVVFAGTLSSIIPGSPIDANGLAGLS